MTSLPVGFRGYTSPRVHIPEGTHPRGYTSPCPTTAEHTTWQCEELQDKDADSNNSKESILQAASEFSGIILESHDDVEDGRDSQLLPGILIQLVNIHTIY